jgi:ankyrin repeat protein
VACAGGHTECVRLLLDSTRCDPLLRNADGLTGRELAEQMQRSAVLELLDEARQNSSASDTAAVRDQTRVL